jgi:hypothetical protein
MGAFPERYEHHLHINNVKLSPKQAVKVMGVFLRGTNIIYI